jgi:Protein of unknown function (DUF2887)
MRRVIYPSRSTEQTDTHPYRALLHSPQVTRIFLDELGDLQTLPLGVALMVFNHRGRTSSSPSCQSFAGPIATVWVSPSTISRHNGQDHHGLGLQIHRLIETGD